MIIAGIRHRPGAPKALVFFSPLVSALGAFFLSLSLWEKVFRGVHGS